MKLRPAVGPQTQIKISPALLDENLLNDDFLSELDVAFDSIKMTSRKTAPSKKSKLHKVKTRQPKAIEFEAVQKTFIAISQNHLKPVTRYLKAIEQGVSSRELCAVIGYVVAPMVSKTKKVYLTEHTQALVEFQKVLNKVAKSTQKKITEEETQLLVKTFSTVEKLFKLDLRGHSTAVLNVLAFYQTVKKNKKVDDANIQKLFAIGIPSISMLRKSSIAEISSLSGIPAEQVTELREIARNFTLFELI